MFTRVVPFSAPGRRESARDATGTVVGRRRGFELWGGGLGSEFRQRVSAEVAEEEDEKKETKEVEEMSKEKKEMKDMEKEEDEKDLKRKTTMTGSKPTEIDTKPQIKY